MNKAIFLIILLMAFFVWEATASMDFEKDIIATAEGNLEITLIGHGSLMLTYKNIVIQVDPFSRLADYSTFPKANLILITHDHRDHLDPGALEKVRTDKTILILTETCAAKVSGGIIMKNGDVETVGGLTIEAIPAYNLVHMRSEGVPPYYYQD